MASISAAAEKPHAVRSVISRCRTEILAEWRRSAREIPAAADLPSIALADHIPDLLDQVAEIADELADDPTTPRKFDTARRHAVHRLGAGFDVSAVVHELSILRWCTLAVWCREHDSREGDELRALNVVFDRAIAESVARYVEARDRTLAAIDTISTASLEATSLSDLLQRLLTVFMRTTEAVQTCAILLRDDDERLRTRATVGLDADLDAGHAIALGEGFVGQVWAEGRPMEVRSAANDPLVMSPAIRSKGVNALYALPLVQDGRVIGVAHMGSLSANQFSQEDKQLFASMCARATVGIFHHMLRERLAKEEARSKAVADERERALAKLESLLAGATVGIGFVDRELRYIRVNDALAEMNGKPAVDHAGRRVAEILPEFAESVVPLLERVLATGEPATNIPLARPNARSLLANYFPVRDATGSVSGVGGIVLDVSEEKRAQDLLRVEQTRLQSILEYTPAPMWIKDADGRIILANRRLADAMGYPYEQVIGRRSEDILPREVALQHQAHDQIVLQENRAIEVEESVPVPGKVRTFLAIKFPIPNDPPLVGAIATEITDRKNMEEELRAAVRTREEVLAVVSHDLRNPLGTVRVGASMLQAQNPADPRTRRYLDMIQRAAGRMETLIDDLLDTANIRAGHLKLETTRELADSILREAIDLQQPMAAEKGIELQQQAGDLQGVALLCDHDRILQVFANLIGNALKFCRQGDSITVTGERVGEHVRFSVVDTGPGIAPDALPHLFDAYWSGADHGKRGVGLGLHICRGIVEGHGGQIWVESTPGTGAKFSFTLPLAQ